MRTYRARSDAMSKGVRGERRGIQIGPKIRVGGTLGKVGQDLKIGAGKVASNPWVQGIAGATLGPGAAAAIGALGKTLDTSHGSVGLGDIAKGGVQGYGAGKLGQTVGGLAKGGLSLGKVGGLVTGGGADGQGNFGALGDAAGKLGGGLGLGSLGGGGNLVDMGLGGLAAANAAHLQGQSDQYAHNALDTANQSYDARAPLRLAGVEGMLHPEAGNAAKLAGVKANTGVGNVFAKKPLSLSGVA